MRTASLDGKHDSLNGVSVLTVPRVFTFVNMLSTFMNMRSTGDRGGEADQQDLVNDRARIR